MKDASVDIALALVLAAISAFGLWLFAYCDLACDVALRWGCR